MLEDWESFLGWGIPGQVGICVNTSLFPSYQYPSLDQLADMIPCILQYLK